MNVQARRRTLTAILAAALLATTASARQPPAPFPPPPPPQPAPFDLAPALIEDAAAYQDYMAKATGVSPAFTSGDNVESAVRQGESYDPAAFQRGEIAYAAIVALQDPNFVANVRAYGADPQSRETLAADLFQNPRFVIGLHGADTAAGLAVAALMGEGKRMMTTGDAVKQAAYDVQHQSWSKQMAPDHGAVLAAAKSSTGLGAAPSPDEVARLAQAAQGFQPMDIDAPTASQPYPPVVINALALAALAALGEAGEANVDKLAPMLSESDGATCLRRAKLGLYECLAVSKPYYEDVFCLGQHVLDDTGQCVTIDAGAPPPVGTTFPPPIESTTPAAKPVHKHRAKRHH